MASQDEVDSTLRWMADEQHIHACAPYGENNATVTDALLAQRHRVKVVGDYKKNMDALKDDPKARDMSIHEAYSALEEVASKRMHCLEDIQQISSLEPLFGQLTAEFATKASQLVEAESARAAGTAEKECGEGVAQAAQNCILAVRANWCWISKLVKCADTHLEHVSDYHQFFHTAAEYNEWMPADLTKATSKVATKELMNADKEEADQLLKDLMEVLTMFLHWHGKTETLFDKSRKIIPVHLRAKKLDYFRPVVALCDYKTKEVTVREGEELTLLDNTNSQSWKVRTLNNTEAQVPAVVLVIPGPEPTAVKTAGNLRLQLLGIWTFNVKRIGKSLIWFMILCNNDWKDDEIKKLQAMTPAQKNDLRRCLTFIEETLLPYWADYKGFQELQSRLAGLREIIDQEGNDADRDADFSNALLLKFNALEELLKRYKDLWTHWDTFRMICETCRAPEFLLIVEKWKQLQYMGMDELRSRWHSGFGFSDEDQDEFAAWLERWLRSITTTDEITQESATDLGAPAESATSEQVTTSEQEEKRTFIITGVLDPSTDKEITMQEAVGKGIINSQTGCYCNILTGESWPIPVAMNAGFIKVEFTTTKKTAEKRRDVGLITIKTQRESRPYTVKFVVDAKTERRLTVDEAITAGILDQQNGTYYNALDDQMMSLADAIDSNLLLVEYDRNAEVGEPEIFSKTFAIHSVVDQQAKKTVTFSEAIRQGLLDRETAAYYHNVTGEYTYVGDAIKRGFIKATVVKDPNSLDIDPENKLVVEHLKNIRKKLLNPMKAIATLRKAAAAEAAVPDAYSSLVHTEQRNPAEGDPHVRALTTDNRNTNVEESTAYIKESDDTGGNIQLTVHSLETESFTQGGSEISESESFSEVEVAVSNKVHTDHGLEGAGIAIGSNSDSEMASTAVNESESAGIEKTTTDLTEVTSLMGITANKADFAEFEEFESSLNRNAGGTMEINEQSMSGNSGKALMKDDNVDSSTDSTDGGMGMGSTVNTQNGKGTSDSQKHTEIGTAVIDSASQAHIDGEVSASRGMTLRGLTSICSPTHSQSDLPGSGNYWEDGTGLEASTGDEGDSGASCVIMHTRGDSGKESTATELRSEVKTVKEDAKIRDEKGKVHAASPGIEKTTTDLTEITSFIGTAANSASFTEVEKSESSINRYGGGTMEINEQCVSGKSGEALIEHDNIEESSTDTTDGGTGMGSSVHAQSGRGRSDSQEHTSIRTDLIDSASQAHTDGIVLTSAGSSTHTQRELSSSVSYQEDSTGSKGSSAEGCGSGESSIIKQTRGDSGKESIATELRSEVITVKEDTKSRSERGRVHTASPDIEKTTTDLTEITRFMGTAANSASFTEVEESESSVNRNGGGTMEINEQCVSGKSGEALIEDGSVESSTDTTDGGTGTGSSVHARSGRGRSDSQESTEIGADLVDSASPEHIDGDVSGSASIPHCRLSSTGPSTHTQSELSGTVTYQKDGTGPEASFVDGGDSRASCIIMQIRGYSGKESTATELRSEVITVKEDAKSRSEKGKVHTASPDIEKTTTDLREITSFIGTATNLAHFTKVEKSESSVNRNGGRTMEINEQRVSGNSGEALIKDDSVESSTDSTDGGIGMGSEVHAQSSKGRSDSQEHTSIRTDLIDSASQAHTDGKVLASGGSSNHTWRELSSSVSYQEDSTGSKGSSAEGCGSGESSIITQTGSDSENMSTPTELRTGIFSVNEGAKSRSRKGNGHTAKGDKYRAIRKCLPAKESKHSLTMEGVSRENYGKIQLATDCEKQELEKEAYSKVDTTEQSDKARRVTSITGQTEVITGNIAVVGSDNDANVKEASSKVDIIGRSLQEREVTGITGRTEVMGGNITGTGSDTSADAEIIGIVTTTSTTTTTTFRLRGRGRRYDTASDVPLISTSSTSSTIMRAEVHAESSAEAGMAAVVIDESQRSTQHAEMMSRICRAAIPLQMIMLILLGMACVVPMTEEEFGCALANGFDSTLGVALRYKDGAPPT